MDSIEDQSTAEIADDGITMLDVLQQEKEMEEEYAAVLGASDEKCCTYDQGAVKRQALYSCLTCCPEARNNLECCAGICLACSYRCHEGHELVELYTKRNFRCDCPTERIAGNVCALNAASTSVRKQRNASNLYNQNFQGLYCSCHRPYPDPENTSADEMLQCAICEDWFHLQHLDAPPNASKLLEVFDEMICGVCMKRNDFLRDYTGLSLKALEDSDESVANISVSRGDISLCEDNDNKLRSDLDKSISEIMNMGETVGTSTTQQSEAEGLDESEQQTKRQKLDDDAKQHNNTLIEEGSHSKCCRPTKNLDNDNGATFWKSNWRSSLCKCVDCLELYRSANVEFLIDVDDSVESYEARGRQRAASETSTYEHGIRALASIGHVQQIEAITEYNRMKDKLKSFLQTFAVSKKVVTEDDINQFFAQMRNEKKSDLAQPYTCR